MSKIKSLKSVSAGVGAVLFASSLASSPAVAAENPFATSELSGGYMLAGSQEGKCGEGKCGGKADKEGKCGEGKCGDKAEKEGKCGEGKCGDKTEKEGKCGEGKCGK